MEIIYRLCKHNSNTGVDKYPYGNNYEILDQEVMICNNKDEFKEIIKSMYGKDIKFKHTSNMNDGDLFISIISYNCYDTARYICVQDYTCCNCGNHFKSNEYLLKKFTENDKWFIKSICKSLFENEKGLLEQEAFCCRECKEEKYEEIKARYRKYVRKNNLLEDNFWAERNQFNSKDKGYIYMITKRSTGEFYVGQTNAVPMFRWVQHLTTERFTIDNIADYIYEILEVVKDDDSINEREAYWINKKRDENPTKSLNIVVPKIKDEKNNNISLFDYEVKDND